MTRHLRFACSLALAALAFPASTLAQGYGPAAVDTYHYELYRGDSIDIEIGEEADWAEATGDSVAAILSKGNKLRLVALRSGTSRVEVTNHERLVWRADVVVR